MLKPNICLEIVKDFKKYADKHGVKWFLLFGTCLGAIRDNNFIKDDVDIDIGVYADDPNLKKMLEDMMAHKDHNYYSYKGIPIRCEFLYKWSLDINPLHKLNGKYYYIKKIDQGVWAKEYPAQYFDILDEMYFRGIKVKVPHNPKEYLTYLYNGWEVKKPKGTSNMRPLIKINI